MESTLPKNTIILAPDRASRDIEETPEGNVVITHYAQVETSTLEFANNVNIFPNAIRIEGDDSAEVGFIVIEIGNFPGKAQVTRFGKTELMIEPVPRKEMVKSRTQKEYVVVKYGKWTKPMKRTEWLYKETAEWMMAHPDNKLEKYKKQGVAIVQKMKKYANLADIERYEEIVNKPDADEEDRAWVERVSGLGYAELYQLRKELRMIKQKRNRYNQMKMNLQGMAEIDFKDKKSREYIDRHVVIPTYKLSKKEKDIGNSYFYEMGGKDLEDFRKDCELEMWCKKKQDNFEHFDIIARVRRVVDWQSGLSRANLERGVMKIEDWVRVEVSIAVNRNDNNYVPKCVMVKIHISKKNEHMKEVLEAMEPMTKITIGYDQVEYDKKPIIMDENTAFLKEEQSEEYQEDLRSVQEEHVEGTNDVHEYMDGDPLQQEFDNQTGY